MPGSNDSNSNRRFNPRRLPKGRIKITCRRGSLDLGQNVALSVLDLSETGVRMVVKEALDQGRDVSISLESQAQARPILRVGKVAWCMSAADGTYCIGVAFDKRLPYRDFLALSQELSSRQPAPQLSC